MDGGHVNMSLVSCAWGGVFPFELRISPFARFDDTRLQRRYIFILAIWDVHLVLLYFDLPYSDKGEDSILQMAGSLCMSF